MRRARRGHLRGTTDRASRGLGCALQFVTPGRSEASLHESRMRITVVSGFVLHLACWADRPVQSSSSRSRLLEVLAEELELSRVETEPEKKPVLVAPHARNWSK